MKPLDLWTVVTIGCMTSVLCTLVILSLWRQNRKRFAGLDFWAADFSMQTAGLLLISVRGSVPDWMSIIASNSFVVAGAILGYVGLERFVGKKGPQSHNLLLLAVFALVHTHLTYISPSLSARSLNVSIALLLVCGQCLWLLVKRVDATMRHLTRWTSVVFGGYCLLFVTRIVSLLLYPNHAHDFFDSGTAEGVFLATSQMLFVLFTYALGLIVNQRLLEELQTQEEKLSKAFHSSPCAILITRMCDGKILEVNGGFTKNTGFSCAEAVGKNTGELNLWANPADRTHMVEELMSRGSVYEHEFLFRKKTGELLTGLFSAEIITINNEKCLFSNIYNISKRKCAEEERERLLAEREQLMAEREQALSAVKTLKGLLPICASCKKVRDDKGYWNQIESYISQHSDAEFSHGLCPDCMRALYPEFQQGDAPEK